MIQLEDRITPATLFTVNGTGDDSTRDSVLTLREALLAECGDITLSTAENAQVQANAPASRWTLFSLMHCSAARPSPSPPTIHPPAIGMGPGGGPQVLVVDGEALLNRGTLAAVGSPVASFYGGIRVAAKNLDGDRYADVVTGSGATGGSGIAAYLGKNLASGIAAEDLGFDAIPGFTGGVFVG